MLSSIKCTLRPFSSLIIRRCLPVKFVAASVQSNAQSSSKLPLSEDRKKFAQQAIDSKRTIPHYYLSSLICFDQALSMEEKGEVSASAVVVKAMAIACQRVPLANGFFMDSMIRLNKNVNVSMAFKTANGHVVYPTLCDAHTKDLTAINNDIKSLTSIANEGSFNAQQTEGGTITVSNMGQYTSVHNFAPIIAPPQSCHLAVGHPEKKLVPDGNQGHKVSKMVNVTLSCDHRIVDGAVGAQWLKEFKHLLEKPGALQ